MKYVLDFLKLVIRLLASFLRRPQRQAWIYVLVSPVETLHGDFLSFMNNLNDELSYDNQTMLIEYMLNQKYNNGATGIYITNFLNDSPPVWTGFDDESYEPVYVGFIGETGFDIGVGFINEYTDVQYDFVVNVPSSVTFDMDEMRARIAKYTFVDKRFNIVTY